MQFLRQQFTINIPTSMYMLYGWCSQGPRAWFLDLSYLDLTVLQLFLLPMQHNFACCFRAWQFRDPTTQRDETSGSTPEQDVVIAA